jgi:hypothetical protein
MFDIPTSPFHVIWGCSFIALNKRYARFLCSNMRPNVG